jgi:uncharacterized membrane protein HdeD (DUF308 family)
VTTLDATAIEETSLPPKMWWIVLLEGIAAVILGVLLITDPGTTLVSLTIFLGVYWLVGGIFDLVRMFTDHSHWGWRLASGLLGILAGILVVRNPLWATVLVPVTLVWVLAALGIVIGVLEIIHGFRGSGWSAGIFGVLSLGLGLLLLAGNMLVTTAILIFAVAGFAIVGGIAAVVFSFYLRKA